MSLLLLFKRRRGEVKGVPARGRGSRRQLLSEIVPRKDRPKIITFKEGSKKIANIKTALKRLESLGASIPEISHDLELIDSLLNPPLSKIEKQESKSEPKLDLSPIFDEMLNQMNRDIRNATIMIIIADE